jgi:PHD/YefM family antitoxin component YafN of YafNO toxin-antitoxin module
MEEASYNTSSGLDNNRDLEENDETERLLKALRDEREAQAALYHELEKERNAAATAANEAMAMITRLQEEKALVQMEARQFQRMVEEKTVYDQEAMEILKEVLARREEEKNQLEDEMRKCKTKLLGKDQATVPERRRNETMQPGCSSRDTQDRGLFPITTAGVTTKRSTARAAAAAARETEKPQEADSVIRLKRKWDSQGTTEEQVFPDQNKG